MRYDIIVLGGGPAGLSAAVAARGRNKSVLVVGNRWQDSPLARAERVDNYLGLPGVTGMELLEQFRRHAEELGADFVLGRVISLMAWNGFHLTVGSELYEGETLVLAPGVVRQAKYPGEAEYLGRGVSYCATCDGMLYRGKPVAVVGRSGDAPREAAYLKSLGCQVVYVAPKRPTALEPDIPFLQANRLEIAGAQTVTTLVADGAPIPCSGVFILRDAVAPTDLLPQLETLGGSIRVDRSMATSIPGVFAAGDCTGGPLQGGGRGTHRSPVRRGIFGPPGRGVPGRRDLTCHPIKSEGRNQNMSLQHFTKESFDQALNGGRLMMVDFWANWCMPCRMLGPVIQQLADQYDGKAVVGKVDVDAEGELAMRYGVMNIPTVIFFKDGKEIAREVGALPPEAFARILDENL